MASHAAPFELDPKTISQWKDAHWFSELWARVSEMSGNMHSFTPCTELAWCMASCSVELRLPLCKTTNSASMLPVPHGDTLVRKERDACLHPRKAMPREPAAWDWVLLLYQRRAAQLWLPWTMTINHLCSKQKSRKCADGILLPVLVYFLYSAKSVQDALPTSLKTKDLILWYCTIPSPV